MKATNRISPINTRIMKREILFRGKSIAHHGMKEEWVYGFYSNFKGVNRRTHYISDDNGRSVAVQPETVGQYIGVKDKDGKQIFEGDIVDCWSQGRHCTNGIVTWMENRIFITIKGKDGHVVDNWHIMPNNNGIDEGLSVIGNIYDNPSLLEKINSI